MEHWMNGDCTVASWDVIRIGYVSSRSSTLVEYKDDVFNSLCATADKLRLGRVNLNHKSGAGVSIKSSEPSACVYDIDIEYSSCSDLLNYVDRRGSSLTRSPWSTGMSLQVVGAVGSSNRQPAENAIDGSMSTRWESDYSDYQWLVLDMGIDIMFSTVEIHWESAYAKVYNIDISDDAGTWTTAYSENNGTGDTEVIDVSGNSGRYIRMYGLERETEYGYALYEFIVSGDEVESMNPSRDPSKSPTAIPSTEPSQVPSSAPTIPYPSSTPSDAPSADPSSVPSKAPSVVPSSEISASPSSFALSLYPSDEPSRSPSRSPTKV
jgi:hypothetical protein